MSYLATAELVDLVVTSILHWTPDSEALLLQRRKSSDPYSVAYEGKGTIIRVYTKPRTQTVANIEWLPFLGEKLENLYGK